MQVIIIIAIIALCWLLTVLIRLIVKISKLDELNNISTVLNELRIYQHERSSNDKLHRDNIMLERINMNLCSELAKNLKEPEAQIVFMKIRHDAYSKGINERF